MVGPGAGRAAPGRGRREPARGHGCRAGTALIATPSAAQDPASCAPGTPSGAPLTPGPRAQLLPNGLAAAPQGAPDAVKEMIAAGNQIAGKPYVYGGGHGLPLAQIAPAYDCSSSVEHLLYGARLVPVSYAAASSRARVASASPGPGSG